MESHRHLDSIVLKMSKIYGADFIETELRVGLTFSNLALHSTNADKTSRNAAHAQKAYDVALRHLQKTGLQESATEIRNLLTKLEANLALLR